MCFWYMKRMGLVGTVFVARGVERWISMSGTGSTLIGNPKIDVGVMHLWGPGVERREVFE